MIQESAFLRDVRRHVLVFDGAMGTNIQLRNLTAEDYGGNRTEGCNEYLIITRPDVIEDIHRSFLEVGVDVIETDTFTASRLKLDEYGLGHLTGEINHKAAQLARRLADEYSTPDHPRYVAGSMGPTGMLPSGNDPVLSAITYRELLEIFREQARYLIEGGVDVLLIETSQDILEVRAAISGIRNACADLDTWLPIQAQVTLDTSGRMLLGTDIAAAMTILTNLGVDIVGMNCSTGPEHMREPVRYLSEHCPLPISTIPNAGLPLNVNGKAVYPLEPAEMAQQLASFVGDEGVNIIGGCCGTSPAHLKAMIDALHALPRERRSLPIQRLAQHGLITEDGAHHSIALPMVASSIRATALRQEPRPLIVGERLNTQGSKKVKNAMLRDDYDVLVNVAREQIEWGAHTLDICLALTERADEIKQMQEAVKLLSMSVEAPLVIDSTEATVIKAALETCPGRAIINSINMENGRQRIEAVLPLAKEHGAAVVALTIDEIGMAKTTARKVEVAKQIYAIATQEYDLSPDALIFDVLTFPLTTGDPELRTAAIETLDAIRQVKQELPGVLTILGVSNVSFGVTPHARAVLNSVFLYHAVEAGLDMAIVNPTHITPYAEIDAEQRAICDDLIYNRDIDALPRFITYYEEHGKPKGNIEERADPMEGLSVDEKIHYMVVHRKKEGIEPLIDQAIQSRFDVVIAKQPDLSERMARSEAAVQTLNTVLLPAMKDVGDRFGAGELILPFVLQSAEVMKKSVAHLEQYLERLAGTTKGKVVLATVYGDVHDIGKNLVNTILSNNGYTVYDLGKQVPINTIIDKAIEVNADAIGLSALLVSTSKQMPLCVQELDKRNLKFPVIVGGAAINRAYGRRILWIDNEADQQRHPYSSGVFYARDAFEGLSLMDQIVNQDRYPQLVEQTITDSLEGEEKQAIAKDRAMAKREAELVASPQNRAAIDIPTPPFWGARVLDRVAPEEVARYLDRNALFRGRWGAKLHGEEYQRHVDKDYEPRLQEMLRQSRLDRILEPKAIYSYYPCWSEGDDVILLDPVEQQREIARFTFPRQPRGERICLADYFAARGSRPIPDVVAFQIVTMGPRVTQRIDELQAANAYTDAYYLHGLGVQLAEAMAEYVNARIRTELGYAAENEDVCRRYSWGYPAIPNLDDHAILFNLMPVTDSIGVDLTVGWQLMPEQSTAALIVHNPAAVYFGVRD